MAGTRPRQDPQLKGAGVIHGRARWWVFAIVLFTAAVAGVRLHRVGSSRSGAATSAASVEKGAPAGENPGGSTYSSGTALIAPVASDRPAGLSDTATSKPSPDLPAFSEPKPKDVQMSKGS